MVAINDLKTIVCPFCGGTALVLKRKYQCDECGEFNEDELRHEELRKKISSACSGAYASEENPIDCTKGSMMLVIGDDEAMGLSELDKPQVTGIFHDPEAIVWVTIDGYSEPMEVDSLSITDLEDIVNWLGDEGYL